MRIFLYGDQCPQLPIYDYLCAQGFDLELGENVKELITKVQDNDIELVVLGATASTLAILKQIRNLSEVSVMVLADQVDTQQRMDLYKFGVDDYVASYNETEEISFRVHALLRRSSISHSQKLKSNQITIDELKLNRKTLEVEFANNKVDLTPVQFRLLWTMVSHKDKVLSKPFLYRILFNREYSIHDRSVDIHVSRVRKKLNQAGESSQRLATIHGKGYCFS
ncbi:MAG: response regulator transcription factor [Acidiferrobacterales bacterium]|nr:response regulator transcription factor [Acidiferrobacterales bacterium]